VITPRTAHGSDSAGTQITTDLARVEPESRDPRKSNKYSVLGDKPESSRA
jgi:hypothetical protein